MNSDSTIQEIQAIPLAHDLGPENAYGSALGRVSACTASWYASLPRMVTKNKIFSILEKEML